MTVLDESLFSYLSNYAGLTALVSTRVYAFQIQQGATLPCVTFQRIDTPRELTHDASGTGSDLAHPRFQFDVWAETYAAAKAINDQVRAALNGKTGLIGSQVETATVVGTIVNSGNAAVIVTCTGMTGSPITTNVAVVSGDTASAVAGKIRTALGAVANITSYLTVGGSGATVTLTRLNSASIANLNISIDNGSCTGLTAAPNSANTSFTSTTIQGALVNGETPTYEPDTKLFRCMSDYVIWHLD
jgi:phage tail sheath gpL-like